MPDGARQSVVASRRLFNAGVMFSASVADW
jgi:hypothetical protein